MEKARSVHKEERQPIEAGKGKEKAPPPRTSRIKQSTAHTLILADNTHFGLST